MGFLRRLLGVADPAASPTAAEPPAPPAAASGSDDDERAYELDLLRAEQERLDELRQRQLRYAEYAWQPPAQGGPRRADDEDGGRD